MSRNSLIKSGYLVPMFAITLALMAVTFLAAMSFSGQAQAAESKVGGIMTDDAYVIGTAAAGEFTTILSGDIQTSQWEDVVFDVSLVCGLTTDTLVKSKGGKEDTSTAEAGVVIQVLVDGVVAAPQDVTFCSRKQTQMAKFGGIMESCTDVNGDGTITFDECVWTDEELQLILETQSANAFNFFTLDLDQGVHHIEVQAMTYENVTSQAGSSFATATIGKATVAINEVKFVKSANLGNQ